MHLNIFCTTVHTHIHSPNNQNRLFLKPQLPVSSLRSNHRRDLRIHLLANILSRTRPREIIVYHSVTISSLDVIAVVHENYDGVVEYVEDCAFAVEYGAR